MLFRDIIGQENIKQKLIHTVKVNRISHAQLFLGSEGSGNLALAIAYAQYISCENKQENDSCGECPSCKKYNKLIHPDLHFVYPFSKTKTNINEIPGLWRNAVIENSYLNLFNWYEYLGVENKQGIISKDDSNEVIKILNLKTFESEYKIMIIWMAEKMNLSAANKLLKIIEEPPQKTLFLLISESTEKILPTILSRTQLIKIPKIDNNSIFSYISEKYKITNQEAKDITNLSNGNYLEALNIINKTDADAENFDLFIQLMRFSYQNKVLELLNLVDKLAILGREKQKNFLLYSLRLIRENFMLNINNKEITLLSAKEAEFSNKFSAFINTENVSQIANELNSAIIDIEMNGNNKVILCDFVLKLVKLIK
ncbi:MAG: DNA polymerase III subunit delta [Bacteroidales bacterium]|jgi:DNA polymerase-3 subunit delta'|nr:DNA polymerase III subunit delta [Bacteroidales bacterium]